MDRAEQPSEIEVGTVVADTYEVVRELGRGGMGAVWEAHHQRLPGKRVAIKVLHGDAATDREALARFRREAEIASRLGHPNIVEVHDFNNLPSGAPYLVLEFLDGESLDTRLARGPLPLDEAMVIVRQIASGLRAAHREQVIHRDLKPQNVFLARAGDGTEVAKVLDFGISKIRGSQTVKTQASSMLGTPQYMSPEQAVGNHAAVDARTDVFALGVMIYEMLSGQPAFLGETIPEVVFKVVYEQPRPLAELCPHLPAHVPAAVHRALAKEQNERFDDVGDFIEALTGTPLSTGRPTAARDAQREALASTVASGNYAGALGAAETLESGKFTPRLAAGSQNGGALGAAETIDSGKFMPKPAGGAVGNAETIDSGKFMRRQAGGGLGSAETIDSGKFMAHQAGASPATTAAPADPAPVPSGAAAPQATQQVRRRSPARGIAIAGLAAAIGAAIAVAAVVRPWESSGERVTSSETRVTSKTQVTASTEVGSDQATATGDNEKEQPAVTTADAAVEPAPPDEKTGAGQKESAGSKERNHHGQNEHRPPRGHDSGDDGAQDSHERGLTPEVAEDLKKARAALKNHDFAAAERLARKVLHKQRLPAAFIIRVRVACHNQDLSAANTAMRNLPLRRQRQVQRICQKLYHFKPPLQR